MLLFKSKGPHMTVTPRQGGSSKNSPIYLPERTKGLSEISPEPLTCTGFSWATLLVLDCVLDHSPSLCWTWTGNTCDTNIIYKSPTTVISEHWTHVFLFFLLTAVGPALAPVNKTLTFRYSCLCVSSLGFASLWQLVPYVKMTSSYKSSCKLTLIWHWKSSLCVPDKVNRLGSSKKC